MKLDTAELLLAQIVDVKTDYREDNHGESYCIWCGQRTDFQNTHCKNQNCLAVRARKLLGIKK